MPFFQVGNIAARIKSFFLSPRAFKFKRRTQNTTSDASSISTESTVFEPLNLPQTESSPLLGREERRRNPARRMGSSTASSSRAVSPNIFGSSDTWIQMWIPAVPGVSFTCPATWELKRLSFWAVLLLNCFSRIRTSCNGTPPVRYSPAQA